MKILNCKKPLMNKKMVTNFGSNLKIEQWVHKTKQNEKW